MKILLLALAFAVSCKSLTEKDYYVTYRFEMAFNLMTVSSEQEYIDTIAASNDSVAYRKAFETFYWRFNYYLNETGEHAKYTSAPVSINITDDQYNDLKKKLSANTIYNIEQSILKNGETIDNLRERVKRVRQGRLLDTIGLHTAPIMVLSARLVRKEYTNYKDIRLSYQNISGKVISGIRFNWYGLNAFGEPADMGGLLKKGFGNGFDDATLRPERIGNGTWSISSQDAKKIVLAWPYEVAFEDGTKWEIGTIDH